jgi:hypothetical protein
MRRGEAGLTFYSVPAYNPEIVLHWLNATAMFDLSRFRSGQLPVLHGRLFEGHG